MPRLWLKLRVGMKCTIAMATLSFSRCAGMARPTLKPSVLAGVD